MAKRRDLENRKLYRYVRKRGIISFLVIAVILLSLVRTPFAYREINVDKAIPLAFHTLPINKLGERFNETDQGRIKQEMEKLIDDMIAGANNVWKVAGTSFWKARIAWGDAPEAPDRLHRSILRRQTNEEQPSYYHIFLVDGPFPDRPTVEALTKRGWGTFLTYEAWTNDPNIPDDDNDPANGWLGEDPPGEVLAHELGHALGLLPGMRSPRHYMGIANRDKLMHENIPCGIALTNAEIMNARKSLLARKFEAAVLDANRDRPQHPYVTQVTPFLNYGDVKIAVASVGTYALKGNIVISILVNGAVPQVPSGSVSYHFIVNRDDNVTTGAPRRFGLWQGAEFDAIINYIPDVGWTAEIRSWLGDYGWQLIGTFPFETMFDLGVIEMHVPMELMNMSEGALIAWKVVTVAGPIIVDVAPDQGWITMDTTPIVLTPPGEYLLYREDNATTGSAVTQASTIEIVNWYWVIPIIFVTVFLVGFFLLNARSAFSKKETNF